MGIFEGMKRKIVHHKKSLDLQENMENFLYLFSNQTGFVNIFQ